MLSSRAVTIATVAGTVLQLAMVIAGHSNTSIAQLFAAGGMGISLVAGVVYAKLAGAGSVGSYAIGGLIVVSYLLGDVTALILVAGTLSSAVTGAVGGWLGHFAFGGARASS